MLFKDKIVIKVRFFLDLSFSALRTQTLLIKIKIDSTNNLNTLFTLDKLEGPLNVWWNLPLE